LGGKIGQGKSLFAKLDADLQKGKTAKAWVDDSLCLARLSSSGKLLFGGRGMIPPLVLLPRSDADSGQLG